MNIFFIGKRGLLERSINDSSEVWVPGYAHENGQPGRRFVISEDAIVRAAEVLTNLYLFPVDPIKVRILGYNEDGELLVDEVFSDDNPASLHLLSL